MPDFWRTVGGRPGGARKPKGVRGPCPIFGERSAGSLESQKAKRGDRAMPDFLLTWGGGA